MKKVSLIFGILFIVLSVIDAAGFLPIDWWNYFIGLFVEKKSGVFYKVVPKEGAEYYIGIMFIIGFILIIYGKTKNNKT